MQLQRPTITAGSALSRGLPRRATPASATTLKYLVQQPVVHRHVGSLVLERRQQRRAPAAATAASAAAGAPSPPAAAVTTLQRVADVATMLFPVWVRGWGTCGSIH